MKLLSRFSPNYPKTIVYMLQSTEYRALEYFQWLIRTTDFSRVIKRRQLDATRKAKLLLLTAWLVLLAVYGAGLAYMFVGIMSSSWVHEVIGFVAIILAPFILSYVIVAPLWVGSFFVQKPQEKKMVAAARLRLASHKGYKVAIAGSFGKTTAKEVIGTVLSQTKKVAITPGNMNTAIGISRFINKLDGDEDILVFELGEETIGDVKMLCELTQPEAGVITGISAAHLSSFGSMDNIVKTIFELKDYLGDSLLYRNGESSFVADYDGKSELSYSRNGVDGWKVSDVKMSIAGLDFSISKGSKHIHMQSGLMGEHNIGILVAAAALADRLGLTIQQITAGIALTQPFEHRMQPRQIGGAWVIDDTYNGNIAGVQAGLKMLAGLDAKRRVYVTPGLVEQGDQTRSIHNQIGQLIAEYGVDETVLMKNSVTDLITEGLDQAGYKGRVTIIDDPLNFYTSLDQFVAFGDIVLMQNDWTDNYN